MSIYQSTKVSPYVYWLTHKVTGQFYIGYREINEVPSDQDLGFFYFTSSKEIKKLKFKNFDFQIIAEFFDGDSAWLQEQRMIEANINNPLCLNGHFVKDGENNKFKRTGPHSDKTKEKLSAKNKGRKVSDETRAKMLGRKVSEETKSKISIAHLGGKHSEESKKKMSDHAKTRIGDKNAMFGKTHTPEVRQILRESLIKHNKARHWYTDGIENIYSNIHPGNNFELGRILGSITKGFSWYNNGITQTSSKDHPGIGWNLGMLKRNNHFKQEIITCPCGKSGGASSMKRYHFENCKSFPDLIS